jgi:hypothetical protein
MSDKTEIVDYEKLLADMAKKATATERPSSSTISVRSGILMYNKEPVKGNKLEVIIIDSTHANTYYDTEWDQDNPTNPVCWAYSKDPDNEEMVPHPKATKPQHENCQHCPHNQWGSDPKGGRGKACKNSRTLAMLPGDVTAEEVVTSEVATQSLPTTSVKEWSNYVNQASAMFGRPPLGMRTELSVEPHVKHQFHVKFKPLGPVDIGMIKALMDKAALCKDLLEKVYDPNPEKGAESEVKTGGKKKY